MFVPRMSAGIRSGVNWMREKSRSSVSASVRTSSVLPSPGTPFEQAMPADEQAGQHAVDDLVVADDHPADLLAHGAVAGDELFGPLLHAFGHVHGGCIPGFDWLVDCMRGARPARLAPPRYGGWPPESGCGRSSIVARLPSDSVACSRAGPSELLVSRS